jgi:hypothetical protein
MKVKDATFANAVRMQNKKIENFVNSEKYDLFFEPKEGLLYINYKDSGITKLVGLTNIVEMTVEQTGKSKKSE